MKSDDSSAPIPQTKQLQNQPTESSYKSIPSGRLKKVAGLVQTANKLTTKLKEDAQKAAENSVAHVNPAPQCLSKVLGQLRAQDRSFLSESKGKRRALNKRFVNSLFMSNIDAEEVEAAIVNLDYDVSALTTVDGKCYVPTDTKYQTIAKSRYDARKHQLVFSTSMTMMEAADSNLSSVVPSSTPVGARSFGDGGVELAPTKKFSLIKDRTPDVANQSVATSYELSKKINPEYAKIRIHRLFEEATAREAEIRAAEEKATKSFHHDQVQHHDQLPNRQRLAAKQVPVVPTVKSISGDNIPITREESEHYFGDVARLHFFDRMRKIMAKLNQLAPFGPNQKYSQSVQDPNQSNDNDESFVSELHYGDDNSTIVTSATLSSTLRNKSSSSARINLSNIISSEPLSGSTSTISAVYNPSLPISITTQIESMHLHRQTNPDSYVTEPVDSRSMEETKEQSLALDGKIESMSLASTFRAHQQLHSLPFSSSASVTSSSLPATASLVTSSLPSLSSEFFAELGSLASNDHIKRRVDRDLLAVSKQRKKPELASLSVTTLSSSNNSSNKSQKRGKRSNPVRGKVQLSPIDTKKSSNSADSYVSPLQKRRNEEYQSFQQYFQQEQTTKNSSQEQEPKKRSIPAPISTNPAVLKPSVSKTSTPSHSLNQNEQQQANPVSSPVVSLGQVLSESIPVSPRTRYITHCLQAGQTPLPHLIIRREFTTMLNLSHYALGDEMGRILAYCLSDLPYLEHVDLNDNRLTDDSLQHIIQAIIAIPTIRILNLSRNKIDGYSSTALAEYVARPDCPIESLILQCADVDDGECADFVQNLVTNEKLVELDLSANLLGSASGSNESSDATDELLPPPTSSNAPSEPPETGGEALALFIASSSCRLQTLRLAWNTMRGYPARMLMQYISYNQTLTFLDLSCNGLGPEAGEILGDALISNKTLRTLLVNDNQFSASATVSICIGITENFSLRHIEMNENPIGMLGGKMIMANAVSWGSRVVVEAKNCNTSMAFDERAGWFDPTNPCQEFHLNLAKPLHRAISIYLLHLVATHSTYIVQSASLDPSSGKNGKGGGGKSDRLEFIQGIARDREEYFDEEQRKVISGLRLIENAASNMELAKELFYEADADGSGKLDKGELQEVLEKIGFPIDVDRLNDIFAVFDVDGAGNIDMSEFILLLKAQAREAHARIREMTEYPITALKPPNYNSAIIPSQKYVPPRQGILHLSIKDGFVQKEHFLTMSTIDQKFAYHMAKRIGDVSWMNEAVRNTKMRYDEGLALYKTLFKEMQDTPQVLMQIIPQMMFPSESRQLIAKVTKGIPREIGRVKLAFGVALRPLLGAFNGYYCLDLSKEIHRLCLSRLLEQSQTWNFHQRRTTYNIIGPSKIGDVSQHGIWSCFRNELLNGEPLKITPQRFQPMPHSGTLEFDFACAPKRSGQELLMSDKRVCKVLSNLAMLPLENFTDGINKLAAWRKKGQEKTRDGALFMPIYAFDPRKAVDTGKAMDFFYDNLKLRQLQLRVGKKKEVGNSGSGGKDEDDAAEEESVAGESLSASAAAANKDKEGEKDEGEGGDDNDDEDSRSTSSSRSSRSSSSSGSSRSSSSSHSSSSSKQSDDEEGEGDNEDETNEDDEENQQRQRLEAQRQRLLKILAAKKSSISVHGKAAKFLEVIEDTFGQLWLYTRHIALIVDCFQELFDMQQNNIGGSRDFGSYAVDIIVMLFGRIVDLHNFELLFSLLDAKDCGALYCRLGMMMLFNPMKPEVTLELDMDRREERLLAKIIVYLSVVEPGINLTFKQFQWKREMDYIPGWELTDMWCTEEGMPIHGKLVFTYYSGEGRNKAGCVPDVFLRKALCAMSVIDEEAALREEDAEIPLDDDIGGNKHIRAGEKHYQENKDIWISYLSIAAERDGSDGRYV